jgi:hypothetical protein
MAEEDAEAVQAAAEDEAICDALGRVVVMNADDWPASEEGCVVATVADAKCLAHGLTAGYRWTYHLDNRRSSRR